MKIKYTSLVTKWLSFFEVSFLFYLLATPVNAQIVPDSTLPNNSRVTNQGNTSLIEGGTTEGSNLFHSFEQFSVPTGGTAYLNNAPNIQNIFSRVTGGSISNIDGLIRANGTANLFLINSNGIIFGSNASLNIGGSFLASTASNLKFVDGTQFNTTIPQTTPLLTISIPVGLQFEGNSGNIRVQGTGHTVSTSNIGSSPLINNSNQKGLEVQPGKTLTMVGAGVDLEGALLTAKGGKIEIASVEDGLVSINPTALGWDLSYEGVQKFQDINLFQRALVNTSGVSTSSVYLQSSKLKVVDGSLIWMQNQGSQPGGVLNVSTTELIEISGSSSNELVRSGLITETVGDGKGADIKISTKDLVVQSLQGIAALTYSFANGGDLNISAFNSTSVVGFSPTTPIGFNTIGTAAYSFGSGGNFTLSTGSLTIKNGANVGTVTYNAGNAGSFTLSAGNLAIGTRGNIGSRTAARSSGTGGNFTLSADTLTVKGGGVVGTITSGSGKGGNVTINATDSLEVIGATSNFVPSVVNAATFNTGDAGDLTINTSKLIVRDGGRVDTSTLGSGKAGTLTINAFDSIDVSGTVPGSINPSLIDSSANLVDASLQQLLLLPSKPTGKSGNANINTRQLNVYNGGQVTVRNDGTGSAGTLQITANSINLDSQGGITASTAFGQGGEINLQTQNLQLQNNSTITAAAGSADPENNQLSENSDDRNGGNITIGTGTLTALENSKIDANAVVGNGGNIILKIDKSANWKNSSITANALQSNGGNLTINANKILSLQNSNFSANAAQGNGGNLSIDTGILALTKNSSISANAIQGNGGIIDINAQGFFRSPDSNITANSQYGINGIVQISNVVTNPSNGLFDLPVQPFDATKLVAQDCNGSGSSTAEGSSFVIAGNGGLPPKPGEPLSAEAVNFDVNRRKTVKGKHSASIATARVTTPPSTQLVEAQGWIVNDQGQVVLTSEPNNATLYSSDFNQATCYAP